MSESTFSIVDLFDLLLFSIAAISLSLSLSLSLSHMALE